MSDTMNNNSASKYYVLFVDDEEKTRKAFSRLFSEEFKILLAGDGAEGFEVFQERGDEIGVIITDQKMPRETGVQFLSKVAAINDDIVRILSTAYAELDAAVAGVNEGGIYRYVTKPWDVPELEITLRRAMELFELRKAQSTQAHSSSLNIGDLILGERVTGLALSSASSAVPSLSCSLPASTSFLGFLGTDGLGAGDSPNWVARYQTQYQFFLNAFENGVEALNDQTPLDWSRASPPSAAIQAAAIGCDGIKLASGGNDSNIWPGPAPVLSETLRPLLVSLSKLLADIPGGTCELKANFKTVDFIFSGTPLRGGLITLATDPDSNPLLSELLVACLQVEAAGGRISILPGYEGLAIRLGFEEGSDKSNPGLVAASQLIEQ